MPNLSFMLGYYEGQEDARDKIFSYFINVLGWDSDKAFEEMHKIMRG